ncbi:phage integrase SAM-like domain-containing protein [Myroides sp. C15-4]|uniref:phage integrase SAM-like domain-containing protein n=1 Tax=Myroides sp. C15-4 TaxID=3400532 RepID=UPI003D2F55A7
MATIKFILQAKKDNAQIHVRISNGRKLDLKKSTGFSIDAKDWSSATNMPKQNSAENKLLIRNLNKLSGHLFGVLNEDSANGVLIDGSWLDSQIKTCFNRVDIVDQDIFANYIQYIIDHASTRETRGGKIGLSKGTIKNYNSFKKIILEFEQKLKTKILFRDINKALTDKFKTWLLNDKGFTVNYAGKQFEFIKTVCHDAQKNDIVVTPHSIKLKPFRQQDKDRYIHTLSFEEIDKIYHATMPTPHLENVKKWILIGCYIGQRGGDLLKLTPKNLRRIKNGVLIDLIQEKTEKDVTLGVSKEYVLDILLHHFPERVSINKINTHIQKVCEIAEINQETEGYFVNEETGAKELVMLPKYNFITSHCFRRSFATNFYGKVPTPILMGITGHSEERVFLKYINKRLDKDANAKLFLEYFEKLV